MEEYVYDSTPYEPTYAKVTDLVFMRLCTIAWLSSHMILEPVILVFPEPRALSQRISQRSPCACGARGISHEFLRKPGDFRGISQRSLSPQ